MTDQSTVEIDVSAARRSSWTRHENLRRVFWWFALPLFRFSPRPAWRWRAGLLRLFGAEIGADVRVAPTVHIEIPWTLTIKAGSSVGARAILYALGPITLGRGVTVSQGAHLCAGTHDLADPGRRLIRAPITIDQGAWICADAFVGPGVAIGANAVVGARAVAMRDVPARAMVVGNPAKTIERKRLEDNR